MLSAVKYANGIFYPGCVNDETMPEHPGLYSSLINDWKLKKTDAMSTMFDCLSVITIWIGTFGLVFGHFP